MEEDRAIHDATNDKITFVVFGEQMDKDQAIQRLLERGRSPREAREYLESLPLTPKSSAKE